MTGTPPSILRASIMLLFVLIGKLIHRETDTLNLVLFVGLLLLLYDPNMLFDVGFELSFLVTFGLVICTDAIINLFKTQELEFQNKHQKDHPIVKQFIKFISPAYLIGILTVPLVAQIWVAPVQMFYFNTFTPYSIIANIIVVPFVAIISFLGFISSIFGLIPFISDFILKITDFIISPFCQGLLNISEYFASFPYAKLTTPSLNLIQIMSYYVFIILFFTGLKNKFKLKKYKIAAIISFLIFIATLINIPNKNLEIITFDVGNADNFLIKTPENKYIMIDTGRIPYRSNSTVKGISLEYLKDLGINNLEILILTHFDNDHAGGALNILKEINVKEVYISENKCDTKASCDILDYIKDNYKTAKNNETIYKTKDLKIKTYRANFTKGTDIKNENSIITEIDYMGHKSLFMGDSGIQAYEKLKNYLPQNIDILKSGHHGAKGTISSKMMKELNPKYVILSVGINTYGHPDKETLDIIEFSNSSLLMTKKSGAIKFVYTKEGLVPYEFKKGKFISSLKKEINLPFRYKILNKKLFKIINQEIN